MSPALGLLAILPGGAGAATAIAVTHARPYADTYVQCKRDAEAAGYERWERE